MCSTSRSTILESIAGIVITDRFLGAGMAPTRKWDTLLATPTSIPYFQRWVGGSTPRRSNHCGCLRLASLGQATRAAPARRTVARRFAARPASMASCASRQQPGTIHPKMGALERTTLPAREVAGIPCECRL
jgi:hypothetical protein